MLSVLKLTDTATIRLLLQPPNLKMSTTQIRNFIRPYYGKKYMVMKNVIIYFRFHNYIADSILRDQQRVPVHQKFL